MPYADSHDTVSRRTQAREEARDEADALFNRAFDRLHRVWIAFEDAYSRIENTGCEASSTPAQVEEAAEHAEALAAALEQAITAQLMPEAARLVGAA